jgi:membrane fusion protein (multidrug efflux system)
MKKISFIAFTAISLSTLLFISSCNSEEKKEEKAFQFLVTKPLVSDTLSYKEYVCQIHSIQHIELRALEKGYLEKIYCDEGKFIKKGQLMFKILPLLYNAEMQKAQAEANYAEIEYQTTKSLADKNIVSKNELALIQAKLQKAKAELALTKVHLGFTEIRAPFDGYMDHFYVRLGSLVNEGDLLTTLADNSKMWVYFNVPEAEYLNFKTQNKKTDEINVELYMANGEKFSHHGHVETIEADFDNETGNIAFRATFPNPEALLRHGETGNIRMETPLKNAIIIPQKSTYEVLDQKYVFVVDKNNKVKARRIFIEAEIPDLYVIKSGLKPDDKIVLEGLRLIKENDKIKYKYIKPLDAIDHLKLHAE